MIIRTQARNQSLPLTPAVSESDKPRNRVMKRKKPTIKPLTVAIYAAVFVALVAIVAASYSTPHGEAVANVSPIPSQNTGETKVSVNEVVAMTVAADVAGSVNLPVATNVANLSVSLAAKSDVASTSDTAAVTKQQIMQSTGDRRSLITYTTKAGDTVDKIAKEYGISKDTVRWANNLTSDALSAKKKLIILPVSGVLHTVEGGDTTAKLAKKYKTSEVRIVTFNDLELTGLKKGTKVIVPSGILPTTERPGYWSTSWATGGGDSTILYVNTKGTSAGNRNAYGNCTWFAWEYRKEIGRTLPNAVLGNANTWNISLGGMGYAVNHRPAVGAIMQTSAGGGGYGHVAVVVAVNSDGSVRVREMNWAGYNVVSERTVPAAQAGQYNYIH